LHPVETRVFRDLFEIVGKSELPALTTLQLRLEDQDLLRTYYHPEDVHTGQEPPISESDLQRQFPSLKSIQVTVELKLARNHDAVVSLEALRAWQLLKVAEGSKILQVVFRNAPCFEDYADFRGHR
jgi:hypothetical protein